MFNKYAVIANLITYASAILEIEAIVQIIVLSLAAIQTIIILVFKILDWYKKSKADGKITQNEITELGNTIVSGVGDVKDNIEDIAAVIPDKKDDEGGK